MLNMLLPGACLICRQPTDSHQLCASCWVALGYISPPLCRLCGSPQGFALIDGICPACEFKPPELDHIRSVCRYTDISRQLIIGLKHAGQLNRAPYLVQMMAHSITELMCKNMMLVPVPLHPLRYFYRGYNQSAELARYVARTHPSSLQFTPHLLRRSHHTPSMSGKSKKQRMRNVRNAFSITKDLPENWQNRPILLLDDVMTTGATLNACAHTLRRSGHQEQICGVVFARVFT